ncbi:hypothetical protein KI688_003608 [Linnemannia hyalina]|uniref:Uncharacterized protein n=1 Tax=Linnemannia hyalina TaxID=64524 RepID=A0A9P8BQP6_9FUNG|nr:hypothetical protein KI688_003608 [Linnemannia hyalina]
MRCLVLCLDPGGASTILGEDEGMMRFCLGLAVKIPDVCGTADCGLGVIDLAKQQAFPIKHLRNATTTSVSWGEDLVLDLILWKTKSTHRLSIMLNPQENRLHQQLKSLPPPSATSQSGQHTSPAQDTHHASMTSRFDHLSGEPVGMVFPFDG